MLTTKFIFITITLAILVLISIKMKVPKTSFPLFIIYLIFIINNLPKETTNNKNLDPSFSTVDEELKAFDFKEKQLNTKELKK